MLIQVLPKWVSRRRRRGDRCKGGSRGVSGGVWDVFEGVLEDFQWVSEVLQGASGASSEVSEGLR